MSSARFWVTTEWVDPLAALVAQGPVSVATAIAAG